LSLKTKQTLSYRHNPAPKFKYKLYKRLSDFYDFFFVAQISIMFCYYCW